MFRIIVCTASSVLLSVSFAGKIQEEIKQDRIDLDAFPAFGSPKCPCVGLEGVRGTVNASVGAGKKKKIVPYPAEAFASCAAWDNEFHPACQADKDGNDSWCGQPWCFVDPCNCEIDVAPKKVTEGYFPDADFRGMGSFWYSYATCGGTDTWATEDDQKKMAAEPKECDKKVNGYTWGNSRCQCIGVAGREGTMYMTISENKTARYPLDTGATCNAWDMDNHPDCQGDNPAKWCKQVWCFVDPCSCGIPVAPKVSSYLADASWSGRPVYFSYRTCGGLDTYTESQHNACVNQQSENECEKQSKCAWNGQQCLGKELVKVCKSAPKPEEGKEKATAQTDGNEQTERKEPKAKDKSGALLTAAPFVATCLALVASYA